MVGQFFGVYGKEKNGQAGSKIYFGPEGILIHSSSHVNKTHSSLHKFDTQYEESFNGEQKDISNCGL